MYYSIILYSTVLYIYYIKYYFILHICSIYKGFPGGSVVKDLPAMQKTWV